MKRPDIAMGERKKKVKLGISEKTEPEQRRKRKKWVYRWTDTT